MAGAVRTVVLASELPALQTGRKWNGKSVQLSISESLLQQSPAIKFGSDVNGAARSAAREWERATDIRMLITVSTLENVSGSRSGGDGMSLITVAATSDNLALFTDGDSSAPAYTRLFFDRRGAIVEADVVLNPHIQFSTDGTPGTFDLQSVLTHEFGHVLGLGHSPAGTATMFGRLSPTSEGSDKGFEARRLSLSDMSAVRSVYGPGVAVDCCAAVTGTLGADFESSGVVWAEEAATGRLVAAEVTGRGPFSLAGFVPGNYRLLSQAKQFRAAVNIGEIEVTLLTSTRRVPTAPIIDADISLIGTNGELGLLPVALHRGDSRPIVLGGTGLDPSKVKFGVSSPYISIAADSIFPMGYAGGISAAAMVITVDQEAPDGDYSVFVETAGGERRYLLGSISVE